MKPILLFTLLGMGVVAFLICTGGYPSWAKGILVGLEYVIGTVGLSGDAILRELRRRP